VKKNRLLLVENSVEFRLKSGGIPAQKLRTVSALFWVSYAKDCASGGLGHKILWSSLDFG